MTKHNFKFQNDLVLIGFGHLIFGILFIWSLYYYQARSLSYDSAWQAFQIIQNENFDLVHGRYLMAAIQWLPLVFVKLGGSVKAILVAYSVSWVLFPYIIYLILIYGLQEIKAGFLLILSLVLTTGATFFYLAAELPLSLAIFSLFVGWMKSERIGNFLAGTRYPQLLGFASACVLIMIASYGQILIGLVFAWFLLFEIIRNEYWRSKLWMGLLLFVILWFAYRLISVSDHAYLGDRIRQTLTSGGQGSYFSDADTWNQWGRKIGKGLWISYVVSLGLMVFYFIMKRYLLVLLILSGTVFYALFGLVISPFGVLGPDHYLMIWGGMIGWPFLVEIFKMSKKVISTSLIILIVLLGTNELHQKRRHFVKRVSYLNFLIDECRTRDSRKAVIKQSDLDKGYILSDWPLGIETLLLSSLKPEKPNVTIFSSDDFEKISIAFEEDRIWLGPHFSPFYKAKDLNPAYFQLPQEVYRVISPPPFSYQAYRLRDKFSP
jgi:hypothetical protein